MAHNIDSNYVPYPVLVYKKLAGREERDTLVEFGEEYSRYMETVPGFIPCLGRFESSNYAFETEMCQLTKKK